MRTMEAYLQGTKLVSKQEWALYLQGLRATTQEHNNDYVEELAQKIEQAILKRADYLQKKGRKIGVLLSGGVDSALIAHVLTKNDIDYTAYTITYHSGNLKRPKDLAYAKKLAEELGCKHKTKELNKQEAEELLKKTATILQEKTTILALGVGMVEIAAIELAQQDNVHDFFGGLGSEDIFAGYKKYLETKDINELCWQELQTLLTRDLGRDVTIASYYNITLPTPFLDEEVIRIAMSIPAEEKIKEHKNILQKKYCLRRAAEQLGLAQEYAWRPKLAAQYGSKTDSAIEQLARRQGRTKKEYVQALREEATKKVL